MLSARQWTNLEAEHSAVLARIDRLLKEPYQELKARPSHKFRSKLVEIGTRLAGPYANFSKKNLRICCEAIEALHLGSLIVDDIQDGSPTRRHAKALHAKLGVPHALSVGNWLYFHASRLLNDLQLTDHQSLRLQKEWLKAIECAHYGQVMDLATNVQDLDRDDLSEICHYTALYKSGSITGLAIALGAIISGATEERVRVLYELGSALGLYLQQMNDLGNIFGEFDETKRFEDLKALKPSFVWSVALDHFGEEAYRDLIEATLNLPDAKRLEAWLNEYPLRSLAPRIAQDAFMTMLTTFNERYPECDLEEIHLLKDRIQKAYE